jgi:RNA polymerase sigma-B factor
VNAVTVEARDHGPAGRPPSGDGEEAAAHFVAYRASGDRALRSRLVQHYGWLARHCARQFAHKGEPFDDLAQVATVGLLKAVDRFDPSLGVAFTSYAVPTIIGELRRYFRDHTWSMHVPRRDKDLYQSLSGVADELSQTLMRSPTVTEMAHRAGMTVEDVLVALELRDVYRGTPLPPDDEGDLESPPLGDVDRGYEAAEARQTVAQLLSTLPTDRDRLIMRLRFIDELSQADIAARVGVSQVQVSRLLRANLVRMRRGLRR